MSKIQDKSAITADNNTSKQNTTELQIDSSINQQLPKNEFNEEVRGIYNWVKSKDKSIYFFTNPIHQQKLDKSMECRIWIAQHIELTPANVPYSIDDKVVYLCLYDMAFGMGFTVEQLEKFIDFYGEVFYRDVSAFALSNNYSSESEQAYTHLTLLDDDLINKPHILMYQIRNDEYTNMMVPSHSMSYWNCILDVFNQIMELTPHGHSMHDINLEKYEDLMDGLAQYFRLSPEKSILNELDNPVYRFNYNYWLQFCPELSNLTKTHSNSIN